MNRASSFVVVLLISVSAFTPLRGRACPELAERDPLAPFRVGPGARAAVVEYFTASKNADAARAAGLIDYEEWAADLGLDDELAKRWAKEHRDDLEADYLREKAAGSSKKFQIMKESLHEGRAVFEVTQERADGLFRWEVKVGSKRGRWMLTGFRLVSIER
jgi:hypothetical protein